MRLVRPHSLPEAEDVESSMPEIRSAYFFLSCRASETFFDLAKMSFRWLRKLLGQKRALEGRHAVPEPEVSKVVELKDQNREPVVYRSSRPIKRSGRE